MLGASSLATHVDGVEIVVNATAEAAAAVAASQIAATVEARPGSLCLVATGATPTQTYAELARLRSEGSLDTSELRVAQLDEYVGLRDDDPRALWLWTNKIFIEPLAISTSRTIRLDPGSDPAANCAAFEERISAGGGIDLAILGLGPNGHLGFNEPPSDANARTRVVDLAPESITSNAAYWGGVERVPRRAVTAGMQLIMQAQQVILLVTGAHKRTILARSLFDEPSPQVPASLLRLRNNVTVHCDRLAWSERKW